MASRAPVSDDQDGLEDRSSQQSSEASISEAETDILTDDSWDSEANATTSEGEDGGENESDSDSDSDDSTDEPTIRGFTHREILDRSSCHLTLCFTRRDEALFDMVLARNKYTPDDGGLHSLARAEVDGLLEAMQRAEEDTGEKLVEHDDPALDFAIRQCVLVGLSRRFSVLARAHAVVKAPRRGHRRTSDELNSGRWEWNRFTQGWYKAIARPGETQAYCWDGDILDREWPATDLPRFPNRSLLDAVKLWDRDGMLLDDDDEDEDDDGEEGDKGVSR